MDPLGSYKPISTLYCGFSFDIFLGGGRRQRLFFATRKHHTNECFWLLLKQLFKKTEVICRYFLYLQISLFIGFV